jgi:hypothetical protein
VVAVDGRCFVLVSEKEQKFGRAGVFIDTHIHLPSLLGSGIAFAIPFSRVFGSIDLTVCGPDSWY